jgi:hypothetical protein
MFTILCVGSCSITFILLLAAIVRDRSMLVRPSVMFLIFFNVRCQWDAALRASAIENTLPFPFDFYLAMFGVPLTALLLVIVRPSRTAKIVYQRLISIPELSSYSWVATRYILAGAGLLMLWYFATVPFTQTGLWVLLTDPLASGQAREDSFKLLSSQSLKYGYALVMNAAAPMLGAYGGLALVRAIRRKNVALVVSCIGVICLAMTFAAVSGARGPVALVVLSVLMAWWLRKRAPLNLFYLGLATAAVFVLPMVLTILREGRQVDVDTLSQSSQQMISRTSGDTVNVAIWYVQYAQNHGFVGIAGVQKLAPMFGTEPVNLANTIGLLYGGGALETISANTSFIIFYYTLFGLGALVPCIFLILLLDVALVIYARLKPAVLTGCVAASLTIASNLAEVDYTSGVFSGGFGAILLICRALNSVVRERKPPRLVPVREGVHAPQPN